MVTAITSAAAIAYVWIFGRPKNDDTDIAEFSAIKKKLNKLNNDLTELENNNAELAERLATVEMLESFEDKLAKRTLDKELQPDSNSTTPPISSDMSVSNEPLEAPAISPSAGIKEKE